MQFLLMHTSVITHATQYIVCVRPGSVPPVIHIHPRTYYYYVWRIVYSSAVLHITYVNFPMKNTFSFTRLVVSCPRRA
jgi:hypothetical protein